MNVDLTPQQARMVAEAAEQGAARAYVEYEEVKAGVRALRAAANAEDEETE